MDIFEIVGKFSLEGLEDANRQINNFSDSGEKSSSKLSKLGMVAQVVGKGVLAVGAAATTGAVALVKGVQGAFGELQQNLGGSEAVFGQYAENVQKIGEDAYKNMGMSQAQFLATANKMGSLFQGSGIDQKTALDMTTQAMQRASDVASVMGISMDMAMESIAGAAKGNFTMMDNLGVAMNATTLEAYAHSKGIEDFTWNTASQAEKNSLAMQMFLERTEQYAGNFARESTDTISGSIGFLGAAWKDFMAGLGNPEADMARLTNNLTQSFGAMINNMIPIIENIAQSLPIVMESLVVAVGDMLPTLVETFTTVITQVIDVLVQTLPEIIPLLVDMLLKVAESIINNAPLIIEAVILLVTEVFSKLGEMLPILIPIIIDAILIIVDTLINNIDLVTDAAGQLILGLWQGLLQAIPKLIEKLPLLIGMLVNELLRGIPQLISVGGQMLSGLFQGFLNPDALSNFVKTLFNGIVGGIKNIFGIRSPSRVMAEIGDYISQGLGEGIENNDSPEKAIKSKYDGVMDITSESPLQKYQLDFNAQIDSLNDGFDRLIGILGQYLPNISDKMDRPIGFNGKEFVRSIGGQMDNQLGKMAVAKCRGNV